MKKILVVGSINVDLTFECDHLPMVGQTVSSNNFKTYSGGKGANQAVGISRLGGDAVMIGAVGDDNYGKKLLDDLNFNKVDVSGVKKLKNTNSGIANVLVDSKGNNQIVVFPGANGQILAQDIDCFESLILESDIVLCQLETSIVCVEYALIKAKQFKKTTILNPAPARPLTNAILKNCDYLIPNETELKIISNNYALDDNDSIRNACLGLIKEGVKNVIVTLGEKGSYFLNSQEEFFTNAIKVKAVDTTAAGDSYIAAFAYSLANGYDIKNSIEFAANVAAITVTRKGAQASLPYKEELSNFNFESSLI